MSKRTINAPQTPLIGKMAYTTKQRRRCHIWLHHERGLGEYEALVIGTVAMYPTAAGWSLAHIPTGRRVLERGYWRDAWVIAGALSVVPGLNTANVAQVRRRVGRVIGE